MNENLLNCVTDILNQKGISYETKIVSAIDGEELYGIIVKNDDVNTVESVVHRDRGYSREDVYDDREWGKCWIVY